ncbi:helix-turn-helix domain-containing protein [Chryseobacterium rhizoplanae]|uniref:helix-turn-helix domain-containing protein n=1 Tax=Chryseobacterium rhizoplanae TaxID=1609531 RepID=UPI001CE32EB1|nr:helix-turn-helix domain-containing protein [Chryseobacterium rhizoplanae]UCA61808.1 helix-turn-helix domain-containing protein [Chryseobacterium rhizoplanae]
MNSKTLNSQIKIKRIPDYKKIYTDLITLKYPHLLERCSIFLEKEQLVTYDILRLSSIITDNDDHDAHIFNARHKSYDKTTIFQILEFQKKSRLNNLQLANYFKLSRNTIGKWKKLFLV